jgi:hypothetical protein
MLGDSIQLRKGRDDRIRQDERRPAAVVISAMLTVVGVVTLVIVWLSVLRAILTPRQEPPRAARWTARSTAVVMIAVSRRLPPGPRERTMTLCGPVSQLLMLLSWLAGLGLGFALLAGGAGTDWPDLGRFFTLDLPAVHVIGFLFWMSAAVLFGLFLVYLIVVANAYTRREQLAASLPGQAARLPDAERMLASYIRSDSRDQLDALFADWTRWLSDVRSTHVSYPALVYYRPATEMCWLHATMIVLDAAALVEAIAPSWAMPYTRALLDTGIRCLECLARDLGIVLTPAVVSLHGREQVGFADTIAVATSAGLPAERSPQEAWRVFQDLRTQYAPYAATIATSMLYRKVSRIDSSTPSTVRVGEPL